MARNFEACIFACVNVSAIELVTQVLWLLKVEQKKSRCSYLHMFSSDQYKLTIEENWSKFKEMVIKVMDTHIPCKIMRSYKDIPWLNHNIKSKIREQKRLHDLAKASKSPNDWHLYSEARNNVSRLLK